MYFFNRGGVFLRKNNLNLWAAIQKKDITETIKAIEDGSNINMKKANSWTPLTKTIFEGDLDIAKILLKQPSIKLDKPGPMGWTPLIIAIRNRHLEIVDLLLKKGANINIGCSSKQTPLFYVLANSSKNMGIDMGIAYELIRRGADINHKDYQGQNVLMLVIENGNSLAAKEVLKWKIDIDARDNYGTTALMYAVAYYRDIFIDLLDLGANTNIQNDNGNTALMLAVGIGRLDFVRKLVYSGADPKIKNKEGKTAIDLAKEYDAQDIQAFFREHIKKSEERLNSYYTLQF